MEAGEIDELLEKFKETDEILSKIGFTNSLEHNLTLVDNFLNSIEDGLKKQDDSTQDLLDSLDKMPPETKEQVLQKEDNIIKHAKELKEYTFQVYSFCIETKKKFNNKKPEFQNDEDLSFYMRTELLPAVAKIHEMNQ